MLLFSIKSAFVLALLYVPYYFLLSRDSFFHFNRKVLISILILSLVLPLCNISVMSFDENPVVHDVQSQMVSIGIPIEQYQMPEEPSEGTFAHVVTEEPTPTVAEKAETTWFSFIELLYVVGMLGVLIVRILQFFRMRIAVMRDCVWTKRDGKCRIYCHSDDIAPCSWMNTIVIGQKDFTSNPDEILLHEKGHISYHHSFDIVLLTIVQMLQWWNPVAYLVGLSLKDVHEYEADDYALGAGVVAKKYQTLLILKAVGSSSYAFANNFNQSQTKKRITMMIKRKSNPWMQVKVLLLIPMVAVALGTFATPYIMAPIEEVVTEIGDKSLINENVPPYISAMVSTQTEHKEVTAITDNSALTPDKKLADGETLILLDEKPITVNEFKTLRDSGMVNVVEEGVANIVTAWDTLVSVSVGGYYCVDIKDYVKKYAKYGVTDKNGVISIHSTNRYEASKLMMAGDSANAMQALDKFLTGNNTNAEKARASHYVAVSYMKKFNNTLLLNYDFPKKLCLNALTYDEHYGMPLITIADLVFRISPRSGKNVTHDDLFWGLGLHCCLAIDKLEEAIRIDPSCQYHAKNMITRYSPNLYRRSELERLHPDYAEGQEFEVIGEKTKLRLK